MRSVGGRKVPKLRLDAAQHISCDLNDLNLQGAVRGWVVGQIFELLDGLRDDDVFYGTVDGLDVYYFECWPAMFSMPSLTIWFTLAHGRVMVLGAYSISLDGSNLGAFGFALQRLRRIHGVPGTQIVKHAP